MFLFFGFQILLPLSCSCYVLSLVFSFLFKEWLFGLLFAFPLLICNLVGNRNNFNFKKKKKDYKSYEGKYNVKYNSEDSKGNRMIKDRASKDKSLCLAVTSQH